MKLSRREPARGASPFSVQGDIATGNVMLKPRESEKPEVRRCTVDEAHDLTIGRQAREDAKVELEHREDHLQSVLQSISVRRWLDDSIEEGS